MTKSICVLAHKSGSDRTAFQHYYENHHAPLAIGLFPFTGYARNHLVGNDDFGWDTISEFWAADIEQAAALMEGPVGETMRADEERFMDRAKIASASAEEVILSAGDRADKSGRRTALLINPTLEAQDARAEVLALAVAVSQNSSGVNVDFATSWGSPHFPASAVIWLPGWPVVPTSPVGLSMKTLRVVRVNTLFQASGRL